MWKSNSTLERQLEESRRECEKLKEQLETTKSVLSGIFNVLEQCPEDCLGEVEDTPERQGWWIREEVMYNISQVLHKVEGNG